MSLYNGPARGGNRGGKDAFNWDQVKSESPVSCCLWALAPDVICLCADDPHRDYYLGHSVKAAVGRWQNGEGVRECCRQLKLSTQPAAVITPAAALPVDLLHTQCKNLP